MNEFEKKLQQQQVKAIPGEWRDDILRHANASVPAKGSFFVALNEQVTALLWPHPKVWTGLAAVWVLIFAVNLATNSDSSSPVRQTPELSANWKTLQDQERMVTQLIEPKKPTPPAEPPKRVAPRPRSESRTRLITT